MTWLLLNWKLALIGALVAVLAGMTDLYLGKRDELAAFESRVVTLGNRAIEDNARIKKEGEDNLAKIKEDHEAKVPEIRAAAVANYLAHRVRISAPSGGAVPETRAGQPVDDAGTCEQIPDTALIESAAEDAAKLEAWQDYARLNGIPVTE